MKWTNQSPTPEQLAAWADGELDRPDAERIEAWLASRPDDASEAESNHRLVQLYRNHPPTEPSDHAWQATLGRIETALSAPPSALRPPRNWRLRLLVGLVAAAAAVVGGVLVARLYRPVQPIDPQPEGWVERQPQQREASPAPEEPDEPFPVATAAEVNIISIDAEDADRVVMGEPLMGTFEVVAPEDIEIVKMEPHADDGQMPQLQRGPEVPMIVVAATERREP
jgi:hypothetical protein